NYRKPNEHQRGFDVQYEKTVYTNSIRTTRKGVLDLGLPMDWKVYDALLLTAIDPHSEEVYTWSWRVRNSKAITADILSMKTATEVTLQQDSANYQVKANGITAFISKERGLLVDLANDYSMKL